ncbi:HAMP domain-containing sensor histidine kinase [uncultured Aquabacterium sp.]|uniref:sensor histidine kinase n=1 Tax=Aquabacterium sp. TaxID=1872578 RepID=UPI0025DF5E2F|nr:HAMP domain-containing sensor histidine kinase [uncultured Aquabacterium sp.]
MNDAFRMLFDQVKSGVVWVQRNGVVRYANKAAVQMTPVMLGQPMMDPVAERTVKAAGQNMLTLPFQFELTTQEAHPDSIRAVVINAPVGNDLMVVLNNVSEERWYSQALENLIGYIDAEMAQPIQTLAGKLPAIGQMLSRPGAGPELHALADEAAGLSVKLGKLHDLVNVFGASAIRRDERILLPDLLRKALDEVIHLADARNVTIATHGLDTELPPVYGSVHWLGKAVSEYLEQSIRSAQPGGLINLAVQAVGTRVMVRARNQGLFVSNHERRSAYVPFGVGDSPKPGTRQGIGLALSQRILEQHGGSVRIEDDFDGVDFVLEIPAGAPATQDAQLSVEQAQRYAKDMSELLARSMSKKVNLAGGKGE